MSEHQLTADVQNSAVQTRSLENPGKKKAILIVSAVALFIILLAAGIWNWNYNKPTSVIARAEKSSSSYNYAKTIKGLAKLDQNKLTTAQKIHVDQLLAQAYQNTSDYKSAIKTYEAELAVKPKDLPTMLNLAQVADQVGDYKTAITYYQKALALLQADTHAKQHDFDYNGEVSSLKNAIRQDQQHE